MRILSTNSNYLLAAVLVLLCQPTAGAQNWPVNEKIDLSSGFGDYRPDHFHGGVDIRTNGKIGWPVTAPVDGYLYRAKMSYTGYGKGVYLMGDDGYIYVFGHLSRLADKIRTPVRETQLREKNYYVDLYFPQDSIRFTAGERIGLSGESGNGAPHIHFEKRTADNIPINPLAHGFALDEKTAPTFERISFKVMDDNSLFDDGSRQLFHEVTKRADDSYALDTLYYFNRPFGILVDGFDQMRPGGMKQAIQTISVYIDGREMYRSRFDSLDFETTKSVNLEYDYLETVNDRTRVRRLFYATGDRPTSGKSQTSANGIWGRSVNEGIGRHRVRIVGEDSFGNTSELGFDFLWGDSTGIFHVDSTVQTAPDTNVFYFTAVPGWQNLEIDSVRLFLNRANLWGIVPGHEITLDTSGILTCKVPGRSVDRSLLRLIVFAGGKGIIQEPPFNGIMPGGKPNFEFTYEIVEDGILVRFDAHVKRGYAARVELYNGDSLLGTEYPRLYNMETYIGLIPPRPQYKRIDRMEVALSSDTLFMTKRIDSLAIYRVGAEANERIVLDDQFSIELGRDRFYKPRFIEVRKSTVARKALLHIDSDHYEIFPESFLCRENFQLQYKFRNVSIFSKQGGICWLDKEKDKWVWLDNEFADNTLTAESTGGGSFVTVIDYEPPVLNRLNIIDGMTYSSTNQTIRFIAEDSLSGLDGSESIQLKLDGKWQIVDYDPETGQCFCDPSESLPNGRHHLAIVLTDRAGNVYEQYLNFFVNMRGNKKRGN